MISHDKDGGITFQRPGAWWYFGPIANAPSIPRHEFKLERMTSGRGGFCLSAYLNRRGVLAVVRFGVAR